MIRNIAYLTFTVITAQTFSFRKISHIIVHKVNSTTQEPPTLVPNAKDLTLQQLFDNCTHPNDQYIGYIYDEKTKYGFYFYTSNYHSGSSNTPKNKEIKLKNIIYTTPLIEEDRNKHGINSFGSTYFLSPSSHCVVEYHWFYIKDPKINNIIQINENIFNTTNYNDDFLLKFQSKKFRWRKSVICNMSCLTIKNTTEGVKLCKTLKDGTEKTVDFQKALDKYINKYRNPNLSFGENFAHPFVQFLNTREQENNKIEKQITSNEILTKKLLPLTKVILTKKEKELLDNSKILTVYHLIPTTCTNKEYIKSKKILFSHPEPLKSKTVTSTLIGTAFDKQTKNIFYWITDLAEGHDIEILLED